MKLKYSADKDEKAIFKLEQTLVYTVSNLIKQKSKWSVLTRVHFDKQRNVKQTLPN